MWQIQGKDSSVLFSSLEDITAFIMHLPINEEFKGVMSLQRSLDYA